MFFITRYNLKIVISIFIFTFYIINQVSIFDFHITIIISFCRYFELNLSVLIVMAIYDQRLANISKQTMLQAGYDIAPPIGAA